MKNTKRILIIAAHPDDEVLGCGGTVRRLVDEGYEAYTLILGEGITSRDRERGVEKRKKEINDLKKHAKEANHIIGVKKIFFYSFPDNRFDTVPILDIIKIIENVKRQLKPSIIFTHYQQDLNVDHKITYNAVITATRPISDESVREIYSFEILSSTEWAYPCSFSPNVFFIINETIQHKIKAMEAYKSELRSVPHPRSLQGIKINAESWGMRIGVGNAEAFVCVRAVR